MAAITFFPLTALLISIRPIVYSITQDWELAYHAGSYTTVFCLGYPACIYFKAALSFLQAQNIVSSIDLSHIREYRQWSFTVCPDSKV